MWVVKKRGGVKFLTIVRNLTGLYIELWRLWGYNGVDMYEVKTEQFVGPLAKLLELIEAKKMDVGSLSLAAVTADFLAYIEKLKTDMVGRGNEEAMSMVADFLVVGAHLILLKSKTLLPQLELSDEEEGGLLDLELRLKLYRDVAPVFSLLKERWNVLPRMHMRSVLYQFQPIFYPPHTITPEDLRRVAGDVLDIVQQFLVEHENVERQLISLESKIDEVAKRVLGGSFHFSDVARDKSREEVVVLFLAVLHLLRDRIIHATQDGLFDDISVGASAVAPDTL